MNLVFLLGRLVNNPIVLRKDGATCPVTRFTLAVDRNHASDDQQTTDFLPCVIFGDEKAAFAEEYLAKGMRIAVVGKLRTGAYVDDEGFAHNVIDVVVSSIEFAESKEESDKYRDRKTSEEAAAKTGLKPTDSDADD